MFTPRPMSSSAPTKERPQRVSGRVGWHEPCTDWNPTGQYRYTDFRAQEGSGDQPAEGHMRMTLVGANDYKDHRVLRFQIKHVLIEGDTAWMAAQCYRDTGDANGTKREGEWLFVRATGGGTPGPEGDRMWWTWTSEEQAIAWVREKALVGELHKVESGNLGVEPD